MEIKTEQIWLAVGLVGQGFFFLRFFIQWIASERKKQSYIPDVFWYLSIGGSLVLLTYACYRRDPVFIVGQSIGSLIYLRNIWLINYAKNRKRGAW